VPRARLGCLGRLCLHRPRVPPRCLFRLAACNSISKVAASHYQRRQDSLSNVRTWRSAALPVSGGVTQTVSGLLRAARRGPARHSLRTAYTYLEVEPFGSSGGEKIKLPIYTQGYDVSDLNGVALQLLLQGSLGAPLGGAAEEALAAIRRKRSSQEGPTTVAEALEMSRLLDTRDVTRKLIRYDWLPETTARECVAQARTLLARVLDVASGDGLNAAAQGLAFEHKLRHRVAGERPHRYLSGVVDIFDRQRKLPIEIKCTSEQAQDHFLQLAMYM